MTPEPLRIGPMCIWRFWLRISSGIKFRISNLNSWDTLYKIFPKNVFHPGKINSVSHWTSELSRKSRLNLSNFQFRITAHILREVLILAGLKLVSEATLFIFRTFTGSRVIIWKYTTGLNNVTETASLSNPRSHFRGDSICIKHCGA